MTITMKELEAATCEAMPSGLTLAQALDFYRTQVYNKWDPLRLGQVTEIEKSERAVMQSELGTEMNTYSHAKEITEHAIEGVISELLWLRDRGNGLEVAMAFDTAIDVVINRLGGEHRG